MEISNSNSCFEESFEYIESKHKRLPQFVELPEFLKIFNSILDGFRPGEVTLISGEKTDDFFISMLHEFSVKKDVFSYVISNRYTDSYIGLNLLKFELPKLSKRQLNLRNIYSGIFYDEDIDELKHRYDALLENRESQGLGRFLPFAVSLFKEKNIEEICENIRINIQNIDTNLKKYHSAKRIIIIRGIDKEDLKQIKELAEIFFVPIIIFMEDQTKDPYADCEIFIKKNSMDFITTTDKDRQYEVYAKNNMTLLEVTGTIFYNTVLSSFYISKE